MSDDKDQPTRLDRFINHPSTQALIGLAVIVVFMSLAYVAGLHEGRHQGLVDCGQEFSEIDHLRKDLSELVKPPQPAAPSNQGAQR